MPRTEPATVTSVVAQARLGRNWRLRVGDQLAFCDGLPSELWEIVQRSLIVFVQAENLELSGTEQSKQFRVAAARSNNGRIRAALVLQL